MTDVYIAGVGMTPFGRHMDKSYKELTAEAVQMALTDAGANKSEVGEAFFASCVIGFLQDQHMVPGQVALRSMGFGVLGIFPRKRTKTAGARVIPGLPEGVTSHFLTVLEYFG